MIAREARVTLRPATNEDRDLLRDVFAATRADELALVPWTDEQKAAFIESQFEAQDSYYRQVYADARFDVIERDGVAVGRLYVTRLPTQIRIIDIALLPEHRGNGVGSALLRDLFAEADASGLPVTLNVEHWNPARGLYERLGFRTIESGDIYQLMERPPSQLNTAS